MKWTHEEDSILLGNFCLVRQTKELLDCLPGRSEDAINARAIYLLRQGKYFVCTP